METMANKPTTTRKPAASGTKATPIAGTPTKKRGAIAHPAGAAAMEHPKRASRVPAKKKATARGVTGRKKS